MKAAKFVYNHRVSGVRYIMTGLTNVVNIQMGLKYSACQNRSIVISECLVHKINYTLISIEGTYKPSISKTYIALALDVSSVDSNNEILKKRSI